MIAQIVRDRAVSALVQVLFTGGIFFVRRATVDRLLNDGPPKVVSRQLALENWRALTQCGDDRCERNQHVVEVAGMVNILGLIRDLYT